HAGVHVYEVGSAFTLKNLFGKPLYIATNYGMFQKMLYGTIQFDGNGYHFIRPLKR
ncbi:unnamed protein product, partial [Sphenostylis stenocarpa]